MYGHKIVHKGNCCNDSSGLEQELVSLGHGTFYSWLLDYVLWYELESKVRKAKNLIMYSTLALVLDDRRRLLLDTGAVGQACSKTFRYLFCVSYKRTLIGQWILSESECKWYKVQDVHFHVAAM